jgi:hypothetical protein
MHPRGDRRDTGWQEGARRLPDRGRERAQSWRELLIDIKQRALARRTSRSATGRFWGGAIALPLLCQ